MKPNQFLLCLDAGHGGIEPKKNVPYNYTTYPSKCSQLSRGEFHGRGWFFEGVFNRAVAALIEKYLKEWGISVLNVYDPIVDISLSNRVNKANFAANKFPNALYLSIHGNAAQTPNARGWEVFTSVGKTKADIYAQFLYEDVKSIFPKWQYRVDYSDQDPDKEAQFYVLSKTNFPAVLSENGFFTNYEDAKMMFDPEFQNAIALCHCRAVVDYMKQFGYVWA